MLLLILALVGCGKSSAPSGGSAGTKAAPAAATTPTAPAAPVPAAKASAEAAKAAPAAPQAAKAAPPVPVKLKTGIAANTLSYAGQALALQKGYFKDEALDVEAVIFQGTNPTYAALVNGDIQMTVIDFNRMFSLIEEGRRELIAVQSVNNVFGLSLSVNKDWAQKQGLTPKDPLDKRLKALKGTKLATLSLGGLPMVLGQYMGKLGGLNPEKDMEFVTTQSPPTAMAMIKQGQVTGYVTSPPWNILAANEGYAVDLVPWNDILGMKDSSSAFLIMRRDWAEKNSDVVKRITKAIARAVDELNSNPKGAAPAMAEYFKQPEPLLLQSMESMKGAWTNKGRLSRDLVERTIKFSIEAGFLKPTKVPFEEGSEWTTKYQD